MQTNIYILGLPLLLGMISEVKNLSDTVFAIC
jgi:hypothetical protein